VILAKASGKLYNIILALAQAIYIDESSINDETGNENTSGTLVILVNTTTGAWQWSGN
jgi:hypothetical protein